MAKKEEASGNGAGAGSRFVGRTRRFTFSAVLLRALEGSGWKDLRAKKRKRVMKKLIEI